METGESESHTCTLPRPKARLFISLTNCYGVTVELEPYIIKLESTIDEKCGEIERLKDLLRWRSIEKDGLPTGCDWVIVRFQNGDARWYGTFYVPNIGEFDLRYVTHWLPISKPEDVI